MKKSFKKTFSLTILILVIGVTFIMNLLVLLPSQAKAYDVYYDWVETDGTGTFHCESSAEMHCLPKSAHKWLPI